MGRANGSLHESNTRVFEGVEHLSSRHILITGGAGFLGMHLADEFRRHGARVRLLDLAEPPPWVGEPEVQYLRGDVRDPQTLAQALQGIDSIVHAAFASPQQSPELIHSINVEATAKLCREARTQGVRRVVLISSTIVAKPKKTHPLFHNSPLNQLDHYRESRAQAEDLASGMSGGPFRVAIVRPKTFLGPGRIGAFAILFDWLRQGRALLVLGSGRNRYQLLHIRDMAAGIRMLEASAAEGLFQFGAREFRTVAEDLQALVDHARTGSRLRLVPAPLARAVVRTLELVNLPPLSEWHTMSARGEDSVVDTSRAERELGWQPRWSNAQALIEAYDWYVATLASRGSVQTTHPIPPAHKALRRLLEALLR